MKLTANIIGATGLVGSQLLQQLLQNSNFEKIRIFVRKDTGIKHPKLTQYIVSFNNVKSWIDKLTGDVLFSSLGTTLAQAGNKEAQYEVDYTFNLNFAKAAKKKGIGNYVLVSSVGANSGSKLFYTRMKGELDDVVAKIGFNNLAILRPPSLVGKRSKKRFSEYVSIPLIKIVTKIGFKEYRPIQGATVAQAMINAVASPNSNKTIWEGSEVSDLAFSSK